jgi:hypothetical protein
MFNIFISPSLLYCSNVWSPVKKSNITCLEKPLRKFTKCLSGFKHLSYQHRLKQLNILTLSNQRILADIIMLYKIKNSTIPGFTLEKLGLQFRGSNLRGGNSKLKQKLINKTKLKQEFSSRIISYWNSLPEEIISCPTLMIFKKWAKNYLLANQNSS